MALPPGLDAVPGEAGPRGSVGCGRCGRPGVYAVPRAPARGRPCISCPRPGNAEGCGPEPSFPPVQLFMGLTDASQQSTFIWWMEGFRGLGSTLPRSQPEVDGGEGGRDCLDAQRLLAVSLRESWPWWVPHWGPSSPAGSREGWGRHQLLEEGTGCPPPPPAAQRAQLRGPGQELSHTPASCALNSAPSSGCKQGRGLEPQCSPL